jgi:hypothetical protein
MFDTQANGASGRPHKIRIAIDPALLEAEINSPLRERQKVCLIGSRTPSGTLEISEPIQEKANSAAESAVSPAERAAMKAFFQEFKRRRSCQMLLGYSVAAWVVLQLSSIVCPAMGLPDWAMRATIGFLLAGYAVALLVGWVLEHSGHRLGGLLRLVPGCHTEGQ